MYIPASCRTNPFKSFALVVASLLFLNILGCRPSFFDGEGSPPSLSELDGRNDLSWLKQNWEQCLSQDGQDKNINLDASGLDRLLNSAKIRNLLGPKAEEENPITSPVVQWTAEKSLPGGKIWEGQARTSQITDPRDHNDAEIRCLNDKSDPHGNPRWIHAIAGSASAFFALNIVDAWKWNLTKETKIAFPSNDYLNSQIATLNSKSQLLKSQGPVRVSFFSTNAKNLGETDQTNTRYLKGIADNSAMSLPRAEEGFLMHHDGNYHTATLFHPNELIKMYQTLAQTLLNFDSELTEGGGIYAEIFPKDHSELSEAEKIQRSHLKEQLGTLRDSMVRIGARRIDAANGNFTLYWGKSLLGALKNDNLPAQLDAQASNLLVFGKHSAPSSLQGQLGGRSLEVSSNFPRPNTQLDYLRNLAHSQGGSWPDRWDKWIEKPAAKVFGGNLPRLPAGTDLENAFRERRKVIEDAVREVQKGR